MLDPFSLPGNANVTKDRGKRTTMAGHGDTDGTAVPVTQEQDLVAHQESYDRFMWWLKRGAVIAFVVAAIVTVVLAS